MNKPNLLPISPTTMPVRECLIVIHFLVTYSSKEQLSYQMLYQWKPIDRTQYPHCYLRETENDLVGILNDSMAFNDVKIYKSHDSIFDNCLGYELVQTDNIFIDKSHIEQLPKQINDILADPSKGRNYIQNIDGQDYFFTIYGIDGQARQIVRKRKIIEVERLFEMPSGLSIYCSKNEVGGHTYYGESNGGILAPIFPIFDSVISTKEDILTALMLEYGLNYVENLDPLKCELRDGDKCKVVNVYPGIELYHGIDIVTVKKDIFGRLTIRIGSQDISMQRENLQLVERNGVKLMQDPRISYGNNEDFI